MRTVALTVTAGTITGWVAAFVIGVVWLRVHDGQRFPY